jgi:hypothetical protein
MRFLIYVVVLILSLVILFHAMYLGGWAAFYGGGLSGILSAASIIGLYEDSCF